MQRAQATVEYVLLSAAVLLATCLLVRFTTPVEDLGRALARAAQGPPEPAAVGPARPARPRTRPPRPPKRRAPRCFCPVDAGARPPVPP